MEWTDSRLTKASSQLRTMVLRESLRGAFPEFPLYCRQTVSNGLVNSPLTKLC